MNSGKRIDDYIEKFLGNSGIISLDVGTIIDNTDQWQSVDSYCDSTVASLHSFVSHFYVEKMGTNEPINYLYDVWKDSEKDDEIVTYSFSADGYVENSRKQDILDLEKNCHFCKYDLTNQEHVSTQDYQVSDDLVKKLEHILQANSQKEDALSFDKFVFYQDIFTKLVLTTYNDKLKTEGKEIKYVTIVLLRSNYDGKWHLSYNAAIFSNNLSYLDNHAIYLLFDYFSRGNYLKEIESLKKNVKKEAIKSAISAIMSRNMSHNLGSHYLYYTKNHLERLANEISNEQSPDIRGAARVLGYTQARMDYLATIISNDKYPYGAVNFKSQIFDELTIDSFSKRHFSSVGKKYNRTVNFLLSNLIRSEDFTRPGIMSDGYDNPDALDLLNLQIKYSDNDNHYQCFTGTNYVPDDGDDEEDYEGLVTMSSEENIKRTLSNIDIALPGGNMSCHAFFNVVENFIRNSAKYLREDFNHPNNEGKKELTTTIALNYADKDHKYINCVIYDDKQNATYYKLLTRTKDFEKKLAIAGLSFSSYGTKEPDVDSIRKMCPVIIDEIEKSSLQNKEFLLREARNLSKSWNKKCLFEQIINRLSSIRILDKSNVLDKENKGLKEMFFSAAWMRAYHFPEGKTYTDIIYEIQEQDDPIKKMNLIREYGLCPIMVLDEGDQLSVLSFKDLKTVYFKPVNFGISFKLPIFRKEAEVKISSDENQMIHNCLDTYADVAIADFTHDCPVNLKEIFTRILSKEVCVGRSATQVLHEILRQRFDSFDDYYLSFGGLAESSGIHDDAHQIKFDHHMKDHVVNNGGLESQIVYAYSDTVSGGNFTKTMNELFDAAITEDGKYKSEDDEYFCLKIKESALTRITLIDERLYDSMLKSETQLELSLKNIRVLDYVDTNVVNDFTELFKGNSFKDNSNNSNFLSIHLGLVEKIIQSSEFINFVGEMSIEERAIKFMSLLRENFGGNNVFIAIHSGRGNFSAELEGPLAEYPFITMSSLESAFNNCKYQLSQLFYNTLYIGKGKINHHSSPEV